MSRTIRRKNGHDLYYVLTDWVYIDGKYGGKFHQDIAVKGKEKAKRAARYHSDARVGWSAPLYERKLQHATHRMKSKTELIRYKENSEYEVQIHNNPRWPWWN